LAAVLPIPDVSIEIQKIFVSHKGEFTMNTLTNENEHPDHLELKKLLDQAKPLMLPMFPDQQETWAAESPLGQEIKSILAEHPEYYPEIRAVVGEAFPGPKH
jgi:hypothetical protein